MCKWYAFVFPCFWFLQSVYNPLQNRINDLQAHCKKVEEQVLNLKQENAQLRKKLSKDGGDGSDINTNKEVEEKMKKLRKRNTELVSLAKQLDERCKALKAENEQLVRILMCLLLCDFYLYSSQQMCLKMTKVPSRH